jgi:hypothetical protein
MIGRLASSRNSLTGGDAVTDRLMQGEVPIACSLTDSNQSARLADWHRLLDQGTSRDVPGGYTIDLPRRLADEVFGLVLAEQHCCPFLTFGLHLTATSLEVTATAPEPASVLLTDLFQPV